MKQITGKAGKAYLLGGLVQKHRLLSYLGQSESARRFLYLRRLRRADL